MSAFDPKQSQVFRMIRAEYVGESSCIELVYDFQTVDQAGDELIERITIPNAPREVPLDRKAAFARALQFLHWIAGVSYYKAGVPPRIRVENGTPDDALLPLLKAVYTDGLGEFAHQNQLNLRDHIQFEFAEPNANRATPNAAPLNLQRRALVPIGGGKDSLVTIEALRAAGENQALVWVGNSPLIAACAEKTGLPTLNITRQISPVLFDYNRNGAYNGHIPVTAINSAILLCAALLLDFDAIVFSNERSADVATLHSGGHPVNHQWSKSFAFEQPLHAWIHQQVASDLNYFSLLRPFSELAITKRFAQLRQYHAHFSSCNRNFRILGEKPIERWCGVCPKCHFVFLALAPFVPKTQLVSIFGRNLLDDANLQPAFDALLEFGHDKPFECVGEGRESRAALAAVAKKSEWREDAIVQHFIHDVQPHVAALESIDDLSRPSGAHCIPDRLQAVLTGWGHDATG